MGQISSSMKRVFEKLRNRKWTIGFILLGTWLLVEITFLPFGDVLELQKKNPTETAFIKDYYESAKSKGKSGKWRQQWVRLEQIPLHVQNAVIISEDGTFWWHKGFDWFEFRESLRRNMMELRAARGASTITQQLIKNLYLSPSKNPLRKLKEWILTWWMETNLSKKRILELYLNVIEWGEGIYGIQAGSYYHFGKPVAVLSREEAARLAVVIPNPRKYKADPPSKFITRQSYIILKRMEARNL